MLQKIRSYFIGNKLLQLKEHHDRVRATTNFNFTLVLFVGFALALIPAFISDRSDVLKIPVFSGFAFSIALLFANKFLISAKAIGFLFVIAGLSVVFSNLFLNTEVLHIGAPLWILVVILYSFYNVGVVWSVVVSIFSFSVYVIWIVYFLNDEVQRVASNIQETTPVLVLEVTIAFVLLIAMTLVYINAIYSKERLLTIKNNQILLKQKSIDEENRAYTKQVQKSLHNMSKYFDVVQKLENKGGTKSISQQMQFSSLVYRVLAQQGRYKDNDPGILMTTILSNAVNSFSTNKISYTVDNTIDFIEEKHVFPLSMVLVMLIYETCQCEDVENIAVAYFFEGGEAVLRYQDDCDIRSSQQEDELVNLSSIILSDVGAQYVTKQDKIRADVELRFPI